MPNPHPQTEQTKNSISNSMRQNKNRGNPKGELNPWHILMNAEVIQIKLSNRPQRILAKQYEVSQSTIAAIKTGRNWGWL